MLTANGCEVVDMRHYIEEIDPPEGATHPCEKCRVSKCDEDKWPACRGPFFVDRRVDQ